MPPKTLFDIATFDPDHVHADIETIRKSNPQRFEFEQLSHICHFDQEAGQVAGVLDIPAEPWWGPGHVPGRPLFPGVLMIEGGAQIATFLVKQQEGWTSDEMIGLAGIDGVRVRGQVTPPARVYFVSSIAKISGSRLARMNAQVFCDGAMVMEMQVMGAML